VNFCSPAVIDRLNALLEPGGELLLAEAGLDAAGGPRRLRPHPAFRLFATMSPGAGDVSRALRNRCVEVWVPAPGEEEQEAERSQEAEEAEAEAEADSGAGSLAKRRRRAEAATARVAQARRSRELEGKIEDILIPV